jgi:phosphatidylglycerol lysyltransferase
MARVEGRVPMAYKVDARMAAVARTRGYAVVRMAREAVPDPQQFTQGGPDKARLRRKLAHARKAGVVVGAECLDPIEAEAVVTDWTAVHGRERGFSMGRWQAEYVAGQRVIAARSAAGVLLAFVSFHASEADWTLDLVRFRPGTPDGTTYAMLACALDLARAEGVVRLSLAAVPEPGFGLPGPLGHLIARVMDRRLGLGQFKAAFAPKWQVRYAPAPGPLALAVGGVEVALAVLWPGKLDRRPRLVLLRGGKAAKAAPVDRAA